LLASEASYLTLLTLQAKVMYVVPDDYKC